MPVMREFFQSVFDMLPDVAGILLAALSLSLIFLPQELKVVEADKWKWLRWTLAAVFAAVGVGGVASNAIQKARDKSERGELSGQVAQLKDKVEEVQKTIGEKRDAVVGMSVMSIGTPGQELKPDTKLPFFISFLVAGNEAMDVRAYPEIFTVPGPPSNNQSKDAHAKFIGRAVQHMDYRGSDMAAGTELFKTLSLTVNEKEIEELLWASKPYMSKKPRRTIYIMARVEWKNISGSDDHTDVCGWMEPPKMRYLIPSESAFHQCKL